MTSLKSAASCRSHGFDIHGNLCQQSAYNLRAHILSFINHVHTTPFLSHPSFITTHPNMNSTNSTHAECTSKPSLFQTCAMHQAPISPHTHIMVDATPHALAAIDGLASLGLQFTIGPHGINTWSFVMSTLVPNAYVAPLANGLIVPINHGAGILKIEPRLSIATAAPTGYYIPLTILCVLLHALKGDGTSILPLPTTLTHPPSDVVQLIGELQHTFWLLAVLMTSLMRTNAHTTPPL